MWMADTPLGLASLRSEPASPAQKWRRNGGDDVVLLLSKGSKRWRGCHYWEFAPFLFPFLTGESDSAAS